MKHQQRGNCLGPDRFEWRKAGGLVIASARGVSGMDLLPLAAANPQRYPFFLESSAGSGIAQSRYDLLLAYPGRALDLRGNNQPVDFFAALDQISNEQLAPPISDLPFVGGWFVYLGYELAGQVEPGLDLPAPADDALPGALAVRCPAAIIRDRQSDTVHVLSEDADTARVAAMLSDIERYASHPLSALPLAAEWQEQSAERYRSQVQAARRLIHAGDVFQVNLSRTWHGNLVEQCPPANVYAALRAANPSPFAGLVQWNGGALACSSPERLLLSTDGMVQTRPIAGTRLRTPGSDAAMTRELLAHPKERAEHVMLIDLERNDLGRVCQPGTIAVDELMVTESYAHVHHIVSNISGRLCAGVGPGGALRAVFPGGTITGCPKVRCMEIIAEQEGEGRGAYTGSIGYLSRCGRMDTNIVIRSLSQRADRLILRTGAGIVADSVPEKELEETRAKACGVLRSFIDRKGCAYG